MAFPSSVPCFEHSDGPPVPYAGENVVLGMMEGMQALHGLHRDVEELGARLEELQQNGAARADIAALRAALAELRAHPMLCAAPPCVEAAAALLKKHNTPPLPRKAAPADVSPTSVFDLPPAASDEAPAFMTESWLPRGGVG